MPFEIDFLNVGDGEKSGDAIAIRFGNLVNHGDQTVVVIDGGDKNSGGRLVEHIRKYYRTNSVDLVINTHPDADHASGLSVLLENMSVTKLWMHQPWNHVEAQLFKDGRITEDSLEGRLREELVAAHELERLAIEKGVMVEEPFTGLTHQVGDSWLTVLGPTSQYYKQLLLDFRSTPTPKSAATAFGQVLLNAFTEGVEVARSIIEDWGYETLGEPIEGATSAENNSSAIVLFQCDGQLCLFTGDAGVPALTRAADIAQLLSIDLTTCRLQQIPHHGSRRNVGPAILDRILGPRVPATSGYSRTAIVSAAVEAPKHPAKKVTNAYIRRGRKVFATKGASIRHNYQGPARLGWSFVQPIPFQQEVEEGDE